MSSAGSDTFSLGQVLRKAAGAVQRNWIRLLVPALLLVLAEFGWARVYPLLHARYVAPLSMGFWVINFVSAFVSMFLESLLTAAVVIVVAADLAGRRAPMGEMLKGVVRNIFPLLAIFCLYVPAFWIGVLLLVFPAFMLQTACSALVPVRVMENTDILQCFRRSAAVTKGHRWLIFGLIASYYVLAVAIYFGMRPLELMILSDGAHSYGLPVYYVVTYATRMVLATAVSAVTASLYFELRRAKEGAGSAAVADVFA